MARRQPTSTVLPNGLGVPAERVIFAQRMIGEMRYGQALLAIQEQFKIGDGAAKRAIQAARILLKDMEIEQRPYVIATACMRLERLADKAEAIGDLRTAVLAQREIMRAHQRAMPINIQHSGGLAVSSVTPAELAALDEMTPEQLAVVAMLDAKPTLAS